MAASMLPRFPAAQGGTLREASDPHDLFLLAVARAWFSRKRAFTILPINA
jgi:hypothetical protein